MSVHEAVRDFYAQHYSANIMKLVLYGRQSLAELEALVRAKFSEVKDKQLQPLRPTGAPRPEDIFLKSRMYDFYFQLDLRSEF